MTRRFLPLHRVALVLALAQALATTATSSSSTPAADTQAAELIATRANSLRPVRIEGIGIKNFGVVDGRIFRGSQPEQADYSTLRRIGIKTVVDLRDDAERYARSAAEAAGMRYVNIPLSATHRPSDQEVARFLATVNDPESGLCYVHCAGGRHRTGSMIALYRLTADGWDSNQAYQEMLGYDYYSKRGHGGHRDVVFDYYQRMKTDPASVPVCYKPEAAAPEAAPATHGTPDLALR